MIKTSSKNDFVIENGVLEMYKGDAEYVITPKNVKKISHRAFCARRDVIKAIEISEGTVEIGGCMDKHSCYEQICFEQGASYYPFELYGFYDDVPLKVCEECNEYFTIGSLNHLVKLEYILLPATLQKLDCGFYDCPSLKEIRVQAGNEHFSDRNGVLFNKDKTILLRYPPASERLSYNVSSAVTEIGDAFSGCKNLESIVLPDGIIEIYGFEGCEALQDIRLPQNLKSILGSGFLNCASLKNIELPNTLEVLAAGAFENCKSLTELRIPDSINGHLNWDLCVGSGVKKLIIPKRFSGKRYPPHCWGVNAEIEYY